MPKTKIFIFSLLLLMACALFKPADIKAQAFLRVDSLRFTDSACYYETTPYGPIMLDVTDSVGWGIDSVKGYVVNFWGDTVIAPWYNTKTGAIDTVLIPGPGKSNTWKCNIDNPKGIKIVRTDDSVNASSKQTKIVLRGTAKLYNYKPGKTEFTLGYNNKYFRRKFNDGIRAIPYGLRYNPEPKQKPRLTNKLKL